MKANCNAHTITGTGIADCSHQPKRLHNPLWDYVAVIIKELNSMSGTFVLNYNETRWIELNSELRRLGFSLINGKVVQN